MRPTSPIFPGVSVLRRKRCLVYEVSVVIHHHIPDLVLTCAHVCPDTTFRGRPLVARGLLDGWQLLDGLGDDGDALAQLRLRDDQGRREPDNVAVSRLGLYEGKAVSMRHQSRYALSENLPAGPCS